MVKKSKAMKNLKYLLLVSVLGLFASCSEDEPEYTPMSVSKISTVLDREEGIEQADLTQYIIVQGKGLSAVSSILVNDIPVDMDEVYVEDTEVTFSIPRVIPGEVNNLVTLSSGKETVTAPLVVYIPQLKIDGMYNEFTPAGEEMKIVGDFFDLYEINTESGQLFWGDQEMEITRAVQDTLYFQLPADAEAGTKVKLVSPIAGEVYVPGKYKETGNMLCDYDPISGWGGSQYVSNGPEPAPISGNYSHFKLAAADAPDWDWSATTTIIMTGVTYWEDVTAHPENYLFKFEVNTLTPLTKRQIRFYFSQINYDWQPFASGLAFNTNKEWCTVSLDLAEIWQGAVPADGTLQILGNSYAEDTDICFDNFRIVPKD